MLRILWVACLLAMIPTVSLSAEETKTEQAHPQEALETAIPYAIKLLETKKYKEMIDSFATPARLQEMKDRGTYEGMVTRFGDGKQAKQLIAALKEAQQLKPEFNEDKTLATFRSEIEGSLLSKQPMTFIKIENRWYGHK